MARSTTDLPPKEQQQTQRSIFLGMLIWFVDLVLLDALTSNACNWHWLTNTIGWLDALQFLEILISLVALALIGWLLFVGWRNWRTIQRRKPVQDKHTMEHTEEDRGALLSFLAIGLNSFFFLFVIATLVPMLSITACGQV